MDLVIKDPLTGKTDRVYGVAIVPRIGEKIIREYDPPPTVKDVIYSFDSDEVFILLG